LSDDKPGVRDVSQTEIVADYTEQSVIPNCTTVYSGEVFSREVIISCVIADY